MNPFTNNQILIWEFKSGFDNAPQQSLAKFANRVRVDTVRGDNQTEDIIQQSDGLDYDPLQANLKFRPLPMLNIETERVGYQRYSHTWNYAIATEDLARVNPAFRMKLPALARASWERFKDRVLAGKSDGDRVTLGSIDLTSLTKTSLPAENRYIVTDTSDATKNVLKTIDLNMLIDCVSILSAQEVKDPITGTNEFPVLVTGHAQIISMLKIPQVQSRDFNAIIPLVRGDVNGYAGFEFIKTAAVGTKAASSSILAKPGERSVKTSATADYVEIAEEMDKILMCYPKEAFAMGIYPLAGYSHMGQNPNRSGALETHFKNTISWKRIQNPYVLMGYAKKAGHPTDAKIRITPTKGADYHANTQGGTTWDYSNTA